MRPYFIKIASFSGTFGDLFAGEGVGKQSLALALCDFTIARTCSDSQPVGNMDMEMVIPEKRIVMAPAWLSFMYSELQKEIEYLGNVIPEIQSQEPNPRHLARNICAAYELALHYQWQLYESDSAKL